MEPHDNVYRELASMEPHDDDYTGVILTPEDLTRYQRSFGYDEHKILQYRDAFSVFDLDADGVISVSEMGQVLVSLGHRPSVEEVQALMCTADKQNKGCIDFPSFLHFLWRTVGVDHQEELREVFGLLDHNSDGFICSLELYDIMRRLGIKSSKEEAEEMIKEADANSDGRVDFTEFNDMLTSQGPREYHSH